MADFMRRRIERKNKIYIYDKGVINSEVVGNLSLSSGVTNSGGVLTLNNSSSSCSIDATKNPNYSALGVTKLGININSTSGNNIVIDLGYSDSGSGRTPVKFTVEKAGESIFAFPVISISNFGITKGISQIGITTISEIWLE